MRMFGSEGMGGREGRGGCGGCVCRGSSPGVFVQMCRGVAV